MAHGKVREAAVIAIPDPKWSERPLALVVPKSQEDPPDFDELKAMVATQCSKMCVPDEFRFISEVPKTSVGKFDKKLLRQWYAEGKL
jgi:fatty-acyl-CoA synthase